jgi:hypothetical protein
MKQDSFYKRFTGNVANFYWSQLLDISWNLKSRAQVAEILKKQ